jgi:hypothetical protein
MLQERCCQTTLACNFQQESRERRDSPLYSPKELHTPNIKCLLTYLFNPEYPTHEAPYVMQTFAVPCSHDVNNPMMKLDIRVQDIVFPVNRLSSVEAPKAEARVTYLKSRGVAGLPQTSRKHPPHQARGSRTAEGHAVRKLREKTRRNMASWASWNQKASDGNQKVSKSVKHRRSELVMGVRPCGVSVRKCQSGKPVKTRK